MYVLIACEFSGRVRDAFIARGHDAVSCDLLPTDSPGPHYQGDVRDLLNDRWDMLIAHPPCTYLAGFSSLRLYPASHWKTLSGVSRPAFVSRTRLSNPGGSARMQVKRRVCG